MSLKDQLGEENYAELLALVNPPSNTWQAWLRGSVKSWTAWFGAFLVAAPDILPQIAPQLEDLFTPNIYKRATQVIGILVILLRIKTTTSLPEKAK